MALQTVVIAPDAVTLADADTTIATDDFTAAVAIALDSGSTFGGRIIGVEIVQHKGDGAVLTDVYGDLYIFSADPSLTAGAATLTAAQHDLVIGTVEFLASELVTDTNAARLSGLTAIGFAPTTALYVAFFWKGATSLNSAAGDNELLKVRLTIERTR